jgi:hypothetical protein
MFAVRFLWRRTAKGSDCRALSMVAHGKGKRLPCVFTYGARQRQKIAVRLPMTHGKESSPCVVRRGARQWEFTVQIATVCSLSCAPMKNARQKLCRAFLGLCRAPVAHGKPQVSRSVCSVNWLSKTSSK